jgi:SAM-dependent methyltransferase
MLEYRLPRLREFSFLFPPLIYWRRKKEVLVLRRARELNPNRVLEVGCGSGYLGHLLSKIFCHSEILGIDISYEMIAFAKRKETKNLRFMRVDFFELEDTFDLVVSIHAFEEMDPGKAFLKLIEILERGGMALLVLTCPGLFSKIHSRFFYILNGKRLSLYRPTEWIRYAKRAGLSARITPIVSAERSVLLELKRDGGG